LHGFSLLYIGIITARKERIKEEEKAYEEPSEIQFEMVEEQVDVIQELPKVTPSSSGNNHKKRKKSHWNKGNIKKPQRKKIIFDTSSTSPETSQQSFQTLTPTCMIQYFDFYIIVHFYFYIPFCYILNNIKMVFEFLQLLTSFLQHSENIILN